MELLVRVLNKYSGPDPVLQAKSMGRGDVVVAMPDGHPWSARELASPSWAILRISGLSRTAAYALVVGSDAGEFDGGPLGWIRAFGLDLELLISRGYPIPTGEEARKVMDAIENEAAATGASRDTVKHSPKYARAVAIVEITEADFKDAKTAKPIIEDRAVIGH